MIDPNSRKTLGDTIVRWLPVVLGLTISSLSYFTESPWKAPALFMLGLSVVLSSVVKDYRTARQRRREKEEIATALAAVDSKSRHLERKLMPRRITPDRRSEIVRHLANSPKGDLTLLTLQMDSEAKEFAADIKEALIQASYTVRDYSGPLLVSLTPGVWISVRSIENCPKYVDDILGALKAVGVPAYGGIDMNMPEGVVHLGVGQKRLQE